MRFTPPLILSLAVALASTVKAEGPSNAEQKMREMLRSTMIQLRTAEGEKANLQAANVDLEQKNKTLTAQVEALVKQTAEDKAKTDKAIAELVDKVAKRDADIVQFKEAIEKWKVEFEKLTEFAKGKEAERARLETKSILLERQVADQQRKNDTMYQLGTEVLNRYEKFGLGDALTAREPFVGITRVKFQNLIQDYGDKFEDNRIKPDPAAKPAAKSGAETKAGSEKGAKKGDKKVDKGQVPTPAAKPGASPKPRGALS